jgi:hypothetical protein
MAVTDIPVGNGNRIMFRASASTYAALALHGRRQGISPSVAARRILDEAVHKGTVEQTLDLLIDRILILDELVRLMLSDVEAERIGEAEHQARLRALSRPERS